MNWKKVSATRLVDQTNTATPYSSTITYETGNAGHWSHAWSAKDVVVGDSEFFQRPALYLFDNHNMHHDPI